MNTYCELVMLKGGETEFGAGRQCGIRECFPRIGAQPSAPTREGAYGYRAGSQGDEQHHLTLTNPLHGLQQALDVMR
jgi:hypothetical protein